jgi:hypothetical protein
MAMMLKPQQYWVGNKRTIWAHLLVKHNWDRKRANAELTLYDDDDRASEMDYKIWRDLYLRLEPDLVKLGVAASEAASRKGVQAGSLKYMWPDAVSSVLFDRYTKKR